ncbi:three-Cys-motif partner protein TcmP [Fusobacterium perfoetens]|uniref:three-Cys-motif partner protein TcmP n=1 Tax=Fusobacterium perfoetens TaxID=852 RepID=UPI00047F0EF4|nr:three-Cys-motif partner protein TcmP [Fusobacterium perfoetens]
MSKLELDEYKEQTEHKHEYLKEYLPVWFYILINRKISNNIKYNNIIYVDSFSNAGEYKNGEEGSPIIALKIFNDILLKNKDKKVRVKCYFNDYNEERIIHLKELIEKMSLDNRIKVEYDEITANEHIKKVMKIIKRYSNKKVLFFIDPYKIADDIVSMSNMKQILEDDDTEIIFNHMVSDVVRNIKEYPEKYKNFYRLDKNLQKSGKEFNEIFINNLKKEVDKEIYTASYEFLNTKNVTIYFLVFITHHPRGYEKIKEAIWRVSDGDLQHKNKGEKNNLNLSLFSDEANKKLKKEKREINIKNKVEDLKEILINEFKGKKVTYQDICKFVVEKTIFIESHIQRKTLTPLQEEGKIIREGTNKVNSTYIFK